MYDFDKSIGWGLSIITIPNIWRKIYNSRDINWSYEEKNFLKNVISKPNEDQNNFKFAKELLIKYKCIEDTIIRANHFADVAIDSLSIFSDNEYKSALIKLIKTSVKRLA